MRLNNFSLVEAIVCLAKFHQIIAKINSLIHTCLTGSEYASSVSSWTKRSAIALMARSCNWLNCQSGFCSQGMGVSYFLLNSYEYFNMEVY